MKIKWSHFDNWLVKLLGAALCVGGVVWPLYEAIHHYRTGAAGWDYFPFVSSSLMIVFGSALLARKAVQGAAEVLAPILDRIPLLRKGATTSSVLVPPQPAQPAQPAKVITTTVTPLPEPPTEGD